MKKYFAGLLLLVSIGLFGCGGGGGGGSTSSTVSGTASQGKALAVGTVVTLTDARGSQMTTTVGKDGFFQFTVNSYVPPFLITSGGFVSFAATSGTTNINPLTTLSMQLALGTAAINSTTNIPKGFEVQFATVANQLLAKLNGVYPGSVSANQKDFLNGNLTIGLGVDALFDYTVYHADLNGTLSTTGGTAGIDMHDGTRIVSASSSGNVVTITSDEAAITTASTLIFPNSTTTAVSSTYTIDNGWTVMVSDAVTQQLVAATDLTAMLTQYSPTGGLLGYYTGRGIRFRSDGTADLYSVSYDSNGAVTEGTTPTIIASTTWKYVAVNAARLKSAGNITSVILPGSTAIRVNLSADHSTDIFFVVYNGVVHGGSATNGTGTNVSTGFTPSLIAGHSATIGSTSGPRTFVFSAIGNTVTINGNSGTWTINSDGSLTVTFPTDTMTITVVSGSGSSFTVTTVHAATPTQVDGPNTMTII